MPQRAVAIRHLLVDTTDQAHNSISPGTVTTLLFDVYACLHDLVPSRCAADGTSVQDLAGRVLRKAPWPH
jgi:hypothetical protein